jgi:hypothetical protein
MPVDYTLYPADWRSEIRPRILSRAGNCCEGSPRYPRCRAANGQPHPVTGSTVVLTIAHMDHDVSNNADDNLAALCQRCHLTHDAQQHAANARQTRDRNSGQLALSL